jgi:uncharacterized protein (UPF0332 family)
LPDDELADLLSEAENRLSASRHLLDERFYDDAVSRAYYSMFFSTVALLLTRNIRVKTHKGLIARSARSLLIRELLRGTTESPKDCRRIEI